MKIITELFKPFVLLFILCGSYYANGQSKTIENEVFTIVESMPEFPGGKNAMHTFIGNNLGYPEKAIENKTEGRIYLNFIVETDGSISNIKILRGIGSGCDEEALRVVSLFPIWKPGMHKGQNVRVSYNLPILFKLQIVEDLQVYYEADTLPGFYGGIDALNLFINSNLKYPINILIDNIIDTVNILYVVEIDGSISNATLRNKKENMNAYDFEAIRSVSELPKFEPGYINGKAVRVVLFQPIIFDNTKVDTSNMEIVEYNYLDNIFSVYQQKEISLEWDSKDVFTVVENMPKFPGGTNALYRHLATNIKYPASSKNNGEQGRVFINFIVEPDGSVSNVRVLRGVSPLLDAEAIRVVSLMPKWSPGIQRGKFVRVSYNLPIKFTLGNTDSPKKKKKRK